jgi:aminobenzoyl-glutamate utilization protein B
MTFMSATRLFLVAILLMCAGTAPAAAESPARETALAAAEDQSELVTKLGKQIWQFAEPAFQEHQSSKLLADTLEQVGFRVRRNVAQMPTAFVAEFGSGEPVVALLAEYDALPGLSNAAEPTQRPDPRQAAGHGCGHNLFGAAITGAAIAAKASMEKHGLKGTLRVYGCPAEEGGCGKAYLIRGGEMKDVDLSLHWHPASSNSAEMKSSLAIIRFRVRFTGKSAHAAGSPHLGRSALDGVELMNTGVNFLREHVPSTARIHYVITDGGRRPNVVPESAEAWYYIRSPKMSEVQAIYARVRKIAEGAALMSETKHEIRMVTGSYEILPNEPLARAVDANLRQVGPPAYTDDDRAFATAIRREMNVAGRAEDDPLHTSIRPFGGGVGNGSTDVGDVSWIVPTAGLNMATAASDTPGHSWGMTACAGSGIGTRGALAATKVLALSTIDLLTDAALRERAIKDFESRRGETKYEPVLDPAPPPEKLDDF